MLNIICANHPALGAFATKEARRNQSLWLDTLFHPGVFDRSLHELSLQQKCTPYTSTPEKPNFAGIYKSWTEDDFAKHWICDFEYETLEKIAM